MWALTQVAALPGGNYNHRFTIVSIISQAESKRTFGPPLNTPAQTFTKEGKPQYINIRHHQDANRDLKIIKCFGQDFFKVKVQ